ncbi:MAG: hypothetical protein WD534_16195 [Phycisphaeraceae bacterium]
MHRSPRLIGLAALIAMLTWAAAPAAAQDDDPAAWIERVPVWHVPSDEVDTLAVRISATSYYLDAAMLYQRQGERAVLYLRHAETGTPLMIVATGYIAIYSVETGEFAVRPTKKAAALNFVYDEESVKVSAGTVGNVFGEDVPAEQPRMQVDMRAFFTPFSDTTALTAGPDHTLELSVQTRRGNRSIAIFHQPPDGRFDRLTLIPHGQGKPALQTRFARRNEPLDLTDLTLPIQALRERGVTVDQREDWGERPEQAIAFIQTWRDSFAIAFGLDEPARRRAIERKLGRAVNWDQVAHHQEQAMPAAKEVLDDWFDRLAGGDRGLAAAEETGKISTRAAIAR